jgi:hypothetical protein
MIVLYRCNLLSSDAGDFLPMTQYMSFTFRSICFLGCLYAVSALVWNPNVGQGTSHLVIVELLYYLCELLYYTRNYAGCEKEKFYDQASFHGNGTENGTNLLYMDLVGVIRRITEMAEIILIGVLY